MNNSNKKIKKIGKTIRLANPEFDEFENFCDCNNLSKSKVLTIIIRKFLKSEAISIYDFLQGVPEK